VSSDPSVVMVSARGVVTARRVGTGVVRVIAHNGVEKRVVISVASYAYPVSFVTEDEVIQDIWDRMGPRLGDLVTLVIDENTPFVTLTLDDDLNLVSSVPVSARLAELAEELLTDHWLPATIAITEEGVYYEVRDVVWTTRLFYLYGTILGGISSPAPHWLEAWWLTWDDDPQKMDDSLPARIGVVSYEK
jgi:hypothetical protein